MFSEMIVFDATLYFSIFLIKQNMKNKALHQKELDDAVKLEMLRDIKRIKAQCEEEEKCYNMFLQE